MAIIVRGLLVTPELLVTRGLALAAPPSGEGAALLMCM